MCVLAYIYMYKSFVSVMYIVDNMKFQITIETNFRVLTYYLNVSYVVGDERGAIVSLQCIVFIL
jgi:hypothetical protein